MSDYVSTELVKEILVRLPAECLLRFRCVCKSWKSIIDNPEFIKLHLDHQLPKYHDAFSGVGHFFVRESGKSQLLTLSSDDQFLNYDVKITSKIPFPKQVGGGLCSSCNGLILIWSCMEGYTWWILNPLTQEAHNLSEHHYEFPQDDEYPYEFGSGFGYDSASDDYKVLQIAKPGSYDGSYFEVHAFLYSLKSDSWKRTIDFPSVHFHHTERGVFVNGNLHYIVSSPGFDDDDVPYVTDFYIFAFNLDTENYRTYRFPFPYDDEEDRLVLGDLNGCLSVSIQKHSRSFEVWLMNEYGNENSWTLLFSIKAEDLIKRTKQQLEKKFKEEELKLKKKIEETSKSEENDYWKSHITEKLTDKLEKLEVTVKGEELTKELGKTTQALSYSKSKGLVLIYKSWNEYVLYDLKNKVIRNTSISRNLGFFVTVKSLVRINQGKSVGKTENDESIQSRFQSVSIKILSLPKLLFRYLVKVISNLFQLY